MAQNKDLLVLTFQYSRCQSCPIKQQHVIPGSHVYVLQFTELHLSHNGKQIPSKCIGEFRVQSYISGKIFMNMRLVVQMKGG